MLHLGASCLAHSEYRSRIPNGETVPGVRALGHVNIKGGGALNPFGLDFRAAGFKWTPELCRKDSDGDGEPNGLELGDPCCVWREAAGVPPMRSWRISHPGISKKTEGVRTSGVPMPNCTSAAAELAAQHASVESRIRVDLVTVQSETFGAFYYTNGFYSKTHKQVPQLDTGGKLVLAILLGYAGLAWCEARQRRGGCCTPSAASPLKSSQGRCATLGSVCKRHLTLLSVAVLYVDVLSGLLHIVLDNPSFTTLPLLGAGAIGFQRHHHHPAGITVHHLANFLQEHLAGMAAALATGLVPARWSAGGNTGYLRLFMLEVLVLSCAMMAAHRWSHTQADELSPLVVALQQNGMLISHVQHSLHHVDYNCNFAIFTGWCNPLLNVVTAHALSERSELWLGALGLWAVLPFLVGRACYRPVDDGREDHAGGEHEMLGKHVPI